MTGLGSILKLLIVGALVLIPVSAILIFVLWFVSSVLVGSSLPYLQIWKWLYIALVACLALYTLVKVAAWAFSLWYFSKKFKASWTDTADAIYNRQLLEQDGFTQWSPEQFASKLELSKSFDGAAKAFADGVIKNPRT